jgi:hypothetical protein
MDYRIRDLAIRGHGMQGVAFHGKTTFRVRVAAGPKCTLDAARPDIQTVFIVTAHAHCNDRQERHVSL